MRSLLICGIVLGPLFYAVVLIQLFTRIGFDITRHPLSLLAVGDGGWLQTANFVLTGLLAIGCAVGLRIRLRSGRGGVWGPLLISIYGLGMITAALFPADPVLGFPPGTPEGVPDTLSRNAVLHGAGFFLAFGSLTVACFVLARRFRQGGRSGWWLYSTVTGAAILPIMFAGMAIPKATSLLFFSVGIIAFGWLAAISLRLRCGVEAQHAEPDGGARFVSRTSQLTGSPPLLSGVVRRHSRASRIWQAKHRAEGDSK